MAVLVPSRAKASMQVTTQGRSASVSKLSGRKANPQEMVRSSPSVMTAQANILSVVTSA